MLINHTKYSTTSEIGYPGIWIDSYSPKAYGTNDNGGVYLPCWDFENKAPYSQASWYKGRQDTLENLWKGIDFNSSITVVANGMAADWFPDGRTMLMRNKTFRGLDGYVLEGFAGNEACHAPPGTSCCFHPN